MPTTSYAQVVVARWSQIDARPQVHSPKLCGPHPSGRITKGRFLVLGRIQGRWTFRDWYFKNLSDRDGRNLIVVQ